jgi:hypothetical protein
MAKKKNNMILVIVLIVVALVLFSQKKMAGYGDLEYFDGGTYTYAFEAWDYPAWAGIGTEPWYWRADNITQDEAENGVSVAFRRTDYIPTTATYFHGTLDITADDEYYAYLNNVHIGHDDSYDTVETYELRSHMKVGQNMLQLLVKNAAIPGSTPETNPAGLMLAVDYGYSTLQFPEYTNGTISFDTFIAEGNSWVS